MVDGTGNQSGGAPAAPAAAAAPAAGAAPGQAAAPAAPAAQTPPGAQGTQDATPRTYTEAEAQTLATKLVGDAKAELGREFKPVREELATTKATAAQVPVLQAQLTQVKDNTWAAEIEASKDKPDAFSLVKRKHELDQRELDLVTRKVELDQQEATITTDKADVTAWKAQQNAAAVAAKHGISADILSNLVPDGDEARLESVAQTLKASGIKGQPAAPGGTPPPGGNLQPPPDKGGSAGASDGSMRAMLDKAKGK